MSYLEFKITQEFHHRCTFGKDEKIRQEYDKYVMDEKRKEVQIDNCKNTEQRQTDKL